jgi:hypothetical protein
MLGRGFWRDLVVSLSIANLLFIRLWLKILPYNAGCNFLLPFSPLNTYLAALLNVVIWGCLILWLVRFCRERRTLFPWLVLCVFLVTCFVVIYGAGVAFFSVAKFAFLYGAHRVVYLRIFCWISGLLLAFLLVRYRAWLARRYAVLPLLFAPYLLVTFGQSMSAIAKLEPSARFQPHAVKPAAPLKNPLHTKVVWIIFDETDYRLCFEKRPSFLSLPAFDSFRQTALFATRAYSPNDNTQTSLPSLLTGIPLVKTVPVGAARLDLVHAGTLAHSDFSSQDTIFRQVKMRGGSSALFGWFLPYGRTMRDADLCHDYPRYNFYTSDSLMDVLLHQPRELVDMRFLPFDNTLLAQNQIGIVNRMRADVREAVRDNDASFMFLHYSVPHSPNIYDRRTGRLGFNRDTRSGYFDNVALADRCLAELRKSMEDKGIWDSSLIVISSDHHWRTNTYDGQLDKQHVPFMVKFPHQRRPLTYMGRFNTILTKDLILNILDERIGSPEEAEGWLDRSMQKGDAPIVITVQQPDAD